MVENTDDGSQYWIETINFVEEPYWTYTGKDLRKASMLGTYKESDQKYRKEIIEYLENIISFVFVR